MASESAADWTGMAPASLDEFDSRETATTERNKQAESQRRSLEQGRPTACLKGGEEVLTSC